MLDFSELPTNGVRFEQLVRELLLRDDLRPFWTGRGADSGRDLLVEERLTGPLSDERRTWLVDCKHFASSGRSVGVRDIIDIKDRCARVGAEGFLLATSTSPSSELVRKLDEISLSGELATRYWDAVEIEKRLLTPTKFALAQQFFPSFASAMPWRVYYSERENRWIAHYLGNFLYAESRAGIDPPSLLDMERIISFLDQVPLGEGEHLKVRAIWHDTPNGPFYNCWFDYLVPSGQTPFLTKGEMQRLLPEWVADGVHVNWEANLQIVLIYSDYYDINDPWFYEKFKEPLYHCLYRSKAALSEVPDEHWWQVSAPPVRTFNDKLMWDNDKERHGFKESFGMSPPYRPER